MARDVPPEEIAALLGAVVCTDETRYAGFRCLNRLPAFSTS
jgi:hypothetical protein